MGILQSQSHVKSFSEFVRKTTKPAVLVFESDDFSPSLASGKLYEGALEIHSSLPSNSIFRIYVLTENKAKVLRKMFPRFARSIVFDQSIQNITEASKKLHSEGVTSLIAATDGSSKSLNEFVTSEFNTLFRYGARAVSGGVDFLRESYSKRLNEAVKAGDFNTYLSCVPSGFAEVTTHYRSLREENGFTGDNSSNFRKHVQLPSVSELREKYVAGSIFRVGQKIKVKNLQEELVVFKRMSNFVVGRDKTGKEHKCWLGDIIQ